MCIQQMYVRMSAVTVLQYNAYINTTLIIQDSYLLPPKSLLRVTSAHLVALISVSMTLSQTPADNARTHILG